MHTFCSHSGRKIAVDTTITCRYHHTLSDAFLQEQEFSWSPPTTSPLRPTHHTGLCAHSQTSLWCGPWGYHDSFQHVFRGPWGCWDPFRRFMKGKPFSYGITFLSLSLTMDFYSNCVLGDNTTDRTQEWMWASSWAAIEAMRWKEFCKHVKQCCSSYWVFLVLENKRGFL